MFAVLYQEIFLLSGLKLNKLTNVYTPSQQFYSMQEFAVIIDLQNFCKCTALLATKIAVSFCKFYSNYLQFRSISMLIKQQYLNMLNCVKLYFFTIHLKYLVPGPALAIGRAGDCPGPGTLSRGLHNITHPLYASPPVKMHRNTIVRWI